MKRYHPALVAMHWLLAFMVIAALFMGETVVGETSNADPAKIGILRNHMIFGSSILVLMLLRLFIRSRTEKPPHADIGNSTLNTLGIWAHWALYAVVIMMCLSGIGTSLAAGLPDIIFNGSGAPLPADFEVFFPRLVHGALASVLMLLIAAHVAAALYHQFMRKDGLLSRMWFGAR